MPPSSRKQPYARASSLTTPVWETHTALLRSCTIAGRIQPAERQEAHFEETERSLLQEGAWSMVDGLLTPAVLAHVIRYQLYVSHPPPGSAPASELQ